MTIRYNNGQTFEAALLSRTETAMRVALKGSDDVVELMHVNGSWISEDCEPVRVEFAWPGQAAGEVREEDCVCSHELAARLIHLLYSGEDEATAGTGPVARAMMASIRLQVV